MSDESADKMLKLLGAHLEKLNSAATDINNTMEPVVLGFAGKSLTYNIKAYQIANYLADLGKELQRIGNVCKTELAGRISKRMINEDMDSLTVDGYKYTPDLKTYVNVTEENKPFVLKWLKAHPSGKELVREDYNANAFTAFVRDELATGKELPDIIGRYDQPALSVRKVKS